jgi:hypothetical protein
MTTNKQDSKTQNSTRPKSSRTARQLFVKELATHYQEEQRANDIARRIYEKMGETTEADIEVGNHPHFQLAIANQKFAARKGMLYGLAALLNELEAHKALLKGILDVLKCEHGEPND